MTTLAALILSLLHPDPAAQAQAVEKALVVAEPGLHRCWEIAATDDFRVEGRVDLRVTVGADGKARKVEVMNDSTGKTPLGSCVEKVFGAADFGTVFADGDQVEVPVTFRAEVNATVRAADATSYPVKGAHGVVKVLIDKQSAGSEHAALVWMDVDAGATLVRPSTEGQVFIYLIHGRMKIGKKAAAMTDDVVVLDDGAAPAIKPGLKTEMLMLFVPGGAEQAYRAGAAMPKPTDGPAPRVVKMNAAHRHDALGGSVSIRTYLDSDKASVEHMQIDKGTTIPEHAHDVDELFYVYEGHAEITIDGRKYPIGPASAFFLPRGAKHALTVAPDQALVGIHFSIPGGPEQGVKNR
jgi:quercetin dioxygenase-like cupin family protein